LPAADAPPAHKENNMMFMSEVRPFAFHASNPLAGELPKGVKFNQSYGVNANTINALNVNDEHIAPTSTFAPRVSLIESGEAFLVRAELPGITTEQLELSFEKDALTIKGQKNRETIPSEARWLHEERGFGTFERTFRFTTPVDADTIQAETNNGILTIRIQKAKSALPKKITVISKS
jgi:HSP20 family protein